MKKPSGRDGYEERLGRVTAYIDRIAERSGYASLQSFNRVFKTVYGMPPA